MIQALSINIKFMEADSGGLIHRLMAGLRPPYHKSVANICQLNKIVITINPKYAQFEQI